MTDDEFDAKLFDYYEGTLPVDQRAEVERRLAARGEPTASPDLKEYQSGLNVLRAARPSAPPTFTSDVTETIHRRSAGRFFGRRTFGDRIPFGLVLIIGLVIGLIVAAILWSSSTGSLKVPRNPTSSEPPAGARDVMHPPAR